MSTAVIPSTYINIAGSSWSDLVAGVQRFLTRQAAHRSAHELEGQSRYEEAEALRAQALRDFADDPAFVNDLFAAADRHEFGERA